VAIVVVVTAAGRGRGRPKKAAIPGLVKPKKKLTPNERAAESRK
jgi:hypothetical protein